MVTPGKITYRRRVHGYWIVFGDSGRRYVDVTLRRWYQVGAPALDRIDAHDPTTGARRVPCSLEGLMALAAEWAESVDRHDIDRLVEEAR